MLDKFKAILKRSCGILPICLGFYIFTYRQVLNDYGIKELFIYTIVIILATILIASITYNVKLWINKRRLKKLGITKEDNLDKEVSENDG